MNTGGKSIPGRENGACKGAELETCPKEARAENPGAGGFSWDQTGILQGHPGHYEDPRQAGVEAQRPGARLFQRDAD